MARISLTRSSSHLIFIVVCVYILFLFNLSKNHLQPEDRPATYMKKSVFHQSGNEANLENTPWPIPTIENVISDIGFLKTSGKKYIFSELGYSHGLGNLMFQIAGLYSIAQKSNAILLIPSTTSIRRAFDFQKNFNESIQFLDEDLVKKLGKELESTKVTMTSCCSYRDLSPILFHDNRRNIEKVDGYFQNFRYFHPDSEKTMKKLFTFVDPIRKSVDEFLENVGISLTVRSARMIETNVANDDQAFEMPEEDGQFFINFDKFGALFDALKCCLTPVMTIFPTFSFDLKAHAIMGKVPPRSKVLTVSISNFINLAFAKTMIVGVHIRHGMDISMNSRNRKHGHVDTPIGYYKRAIEQISNVYDSVAFIICSDDVAWARRNLKLGKETAHFYCPGPREVDMAILTSCDSLIMSTGTFGWWSGYLNVNASPDVYYYKHWPAEGSVIEKMTNKTEYFLKSWTPLE
ncbi:hypothetical protein CAEBREN_21376 [Caenorhabditis brenneri]|uniref:L-Fucosyltransferase n=1 Tax=Caenorhabditis brenneri TaxID=135651 RepID=G0NH84_CAEBE|nr:hypothetical protein CAEBREN_21376 [Caenorhabditis brenneri]